MIKEEDVPYFERDTVIAYDDDGEITCELFKASDWEYFYYSEDRGCHVIRRTGRRKSNRSLKIVWWAYFDDMCKKFSEKT